ncbi:transmembrane protein 255B-like [Antedon mediterranea]|uniref:transmembrane protein 255B-like n=1 Tax=Antedon mediterranea TaxID=105859 RepID=UPI003AF8FA9A
MQQTTVPVRIEQRTPEYGRRKKCAIWMSVLLFISSSLEFAIGMYLYFMVINYYVGAFWSSIGAILGVCIGLVGVYYKKEGRSFMQWGVRFIVLSILMCICGAIIDGVAAAAADDVDVDQCSYSANKTRVECTVGTTICTAEVPADTCYCCYLLDIDCTFSSKGPKDVPTHIEGVSSCDGFVVYMWLLWISVGLCSLNTLLGLITAAQISGFNKTVRSQPALYVTSAMPPQTNVYITPPPQQALAYQGQPQPYQGQPQPYQGQAQQYPQATYPMQAGASPYQGKQQEPPPPYNYDYTSTEASQEPVVPSAPPAL